MGNEIQYAGVLATDIEVQTKGSGKFAIFVNQNDVLQFNVRLISQNPVKNPDINFYVGYSNRYSNIKDTREYIEESRIKNYEDELNKYFLGFTYKLNYSGFPIIEKLMLKTKLNTYTPDKKYLSVPTYRKGNTIGGEYFEYSYNIEEIIDRLKNNRPLGRVEGFVTDGDTPPFILWDTGETKYAIGSFKEHKYNLSGFSFEFNELKYIPFLDNWYDEIFHFPENESISYIESETYKEIIIALDNSEAIYKNEVISAEDNSLSAESNEDTDLNEKDLIEQFELIAKNDGLFYDRKDLINFHTAMKTSQLVILSGMSGTGKSRLVSCYAKALGLADEFKVIPVRPSWNDDSDLLGFVDSMHMVYRSSDTGFVDLLQSAGEEINKDNIYIVCFDEMNLARVEYYFSRLLSILEMPEKSRVLELYNTDMSGKLYNSSKYKREIMIGENVKFVGTVNVDESTFHFSDKVLDRANVISLNVVPYDTWKTLDISDKSKIKGTTLTFSEYQKYVIKKENLKPLSIREQQFLWEIHLMFNRVNRNLGVGPRIVKKINNYIENIPKLMELKRKEAFDLQIVQRVLTKLRGPKEQLKGILGLEENPKSKNFYDIITQYKDISDFKNTIEMLDRKKRELEIYGYTL